MLVEKEPMSSFWFSFLGGKRDVIPHILKYIVKYLYSTLNKHFFFNIVHTYLENIFTAFGKTATNQLL